MPLTVALVDGNGQHPVAGVRAKNNLSEVVFTPTWAQMQHKFKFLLQIFKGECKTSNNIIFAVKTLWRFNLHLSC